MRLWSFRNSSVAVFCQSPPGSPYCLSASTLIAHGSIVVGLVLMAPRSQEAAAWFATVYRAVQEIPEGKVTTYSRIARLVGYRMYKTTFPNLKIDSKFHTAERPRYDALAAS